VESKKKKRLDSRAKGARSERVLVKLFTEWWGADFGRTPLSGGAFTSKKMRDDLNASGDLVCSDPLFPYTVECKHVEGFEFSQLLTAPRCDFYSWWDQTIGETSQGKIPLLVFTKNRSPWFFAMYTKDTNKLRLGRCLFIDIHTDNVTIGLLTNLMTHENRLMLSL